MRGDLLHPINKERDGFNRPGHGHAITYLFLSCFVKSCIAASSSISCSHHTLSRDEQDNRYSVSVAVLTLQLLCLIKRTKGGRGILRGTPCPMSS